VIDEEFAFFIIICTYHPHQIPRDTLTTMRLIIKIISNLRNLTAVLIPQDSKLWRLLRNICVKLLPDNLRGFRGKKGSKDEIRDIIDSFSRATKDVYFIQIGSCDGVTEDPIHTFIMRDRWSGILVEPIKYIFDRLVKTYQGRDNLIFENVAISNKDEIKDFWYLRESNDLPSHSILIGSFNYEHLLKHAEYIPNIDEYIVKERITCITFESLLQKHYVRKVDLIHIDAEGYDFEIIKQIDFGNYSPKIILFEHTHLHLKDREECMSYLSNCGYSIIYSKGDAIAIRSNKIYRK